MIAVSVFSPAIIAAVIAIGSAAPGPLLFALAFML